MWKFDQVDFIVNTNLKVQKLVEIKKIVLNNNFSRKYLIDNVN